VKRRRFKKICALVLGSATVATLVAAFPQAGAASPAGPATLTAAPATDLVDGQFVKLTFTGFDPTIAIVFRQCIPSPVTVATDCTPQNTQVTGITDATGAGSVYLPIHAGKLNSASGKETISCDLTHPCVIAGVRNLTDLTTAVYTPLTFARSKDDCPPPPPDAILGSGSWSAYRALYQWQSAVCIPPANLSVGYAVNNSADGFANLLNGLTDFAVTGPFTRVPAPITPPATPLTYKFAPVSTSAVVLGYRMYDNSGPQIVSLTLTPDLIAKIFTGKIPNWAANAEIKALNPGVQFPTRIIPFVRGEHSSQSLVFTSWLAANAPPATWTAGASDIFPIAPSGVVGVTGSNGLGLAVADPLTDWLGQGNIGFMDSSTAAFFGLPTVRIQRADKSVVTATPDAIAKAIQDATLNSDGTLALNYGNTNPLAYSMAIPTYMVVPTNTITPSRGAALAAFLRYAVQDGQKTLPTGYAPLPANLVQVSIQAAAAIPAAPPPTPTPSPSPSPAASPTPAPTPSPSPTPAPAPPPPSTSTGYSYPGSLPLSVVLPAQVAPVGALPRPSASPCPSPASPTATPASSTPRAAPMPAPAPAPTPAPQAQPTGTASAKPAASPCPPVTGGVKATPATKRPAALGLSQLGDTTGGRLLLPVILGFALLGLGGGAALEVVARRRRDPVTGSAQ
jgi:ABC-type phosphate transport system substrate-binding protein